ncbi:sickle tail protein homolog isoform X2 [Poeciliopsis prolifica]|uniref:sickle tail protein homolog isoform X2 n=1 Tax=Poeciliopsis prolifica TaxID=188132 RepID=UPI0024132E13|nr:sickle tail protein homolog isoform X2 [Poeciliopsis prolifica]
MSKSFSRVDWHGPAGWKSPSLRKEVHGNRSCMLRIGERLMRAGSEGNLLDKPIKIHKQIFSDGSQQGSKGHAQPPGLQDKPMCTGTNISKDFGILPSNLSHSTNLTASSSGIEHLTKKREHTDINLSTVDPVLSSPNTLPRNFTLVGATCKDEQQNSQKIPKLDLEKKKDVFLKHLKQKYPHHADVIIGHGESTKMRNLLSSKSLDCSFVESLVKEQEPWVLETMSDGELPSTSVTFTRGCKARASLPAVRSNCQTRDKLPGVLLLQYEGETKQVMISTEVSSHDTLQALFVTAFPHQLTMQMLQPPNMAICIKDTKRNMYYDLKDLRDITPNSCLKAYHKDPVHVFCPSARSANSEGMISKEVLYESHSPIHSKHSSGRNTLHSLQGSMSPPIVRSMPSSPSRLAYSGGGILGKKGMVDPGSTTIPRECQPGRRRSSTVFSSSSAILERRDVKPDGDMNKSTALVLRGDGGSHYPEYYRSTSVEVGRGHHSISSYCSSPPMLTGGKAEVGVLGIPGGLQQYRASIKPLTIHGDSLQNHSNSLHRQKNRKYGDSQTHPIKSPPPSSLKGNEVRMFNGQVIGGASQVSLQSMSPSHRSLERNSSGLTVDVINRRGSSSSSSAVFLDSPLGQPETVFPAHISPCNVQSERMRAMEEQIASLAGLVHHALSMKSDVLGQKEVISQRPEDKLLSNRLGEKFSEAFSDSKTPAALTESFSPTPLALEVSSCDGGLRHNLMSVKRNICELRLQLSQLKCLQLSNMESVSSMLRMAGPELVMLMCEKLAQFEDVAHRHRAEMDEDRIRYLSSEEKILTQLSELEDFVESLESSSSVHGQPSFTLRDVEEGAVSLWRLGEALAVLKGEFPVLQAKMRSVLRLEVEAVRFLKEEPHMMDSMLKRVKVLTESFSSLRRLVSNSAPSARSIQVEPLKVHNQETPTTQTAHSSPKPQSRHSVKAPRSQAEDNSGASGSPSRMKSTITSNQHNSSPPTTSNGLDLISVVKNTHRPTPEGSMCVDIRSINQSSTTNDPQQESNDPSHSQSVHLQETPNTNIKSIVDVPECTASGMKSPSALTPQQNTPVELIHGADISGTQKDTTLKKSVDVNSRERRSLNTDVADSPPAVCPQAESSRRPQAEKPRCSTNKRQASNLPPPPQRSGEPVIITSRETDGIQVAKEISKEIHLPSGNEKTPPPVTKMWPSDMAKYGQRFTPQFEHPNVSSVKAQTPGVATALHRAKMTTGLAKMKVQQVPSINCTSVTKVWTGEMELQTLPPKHKEDILVMNVSDQCKDEAVGHIFSSAVAKKLVIPLKEQNQNPKQTNGFVKKPLDEKANGMLVSCLQNENVHEERQIQLPPRSGPKQLWSSAHEHKTSPSVPKPFSCLPDVADRPSSTQQEQDAVLEGSRDQPAWREGGNLSFTATDDRAAPLSPQTPECIHRIPHTHISSQPGNMTDSEGSYMDYIHCGFQDNDESDKDSVIVFIEDTEDFYIPLSTILECEEEDEELMATNRTLKEEPDLKLKFPTGHDSDILGNMKTSPQSASFCDSVSQLQGQDQTNMNMKTCSKKKFSINFPKNKLTALSQVIRRGKNKKGKQFSKIDAHDKEQKAGTRPVIESKQTNEVSMSQQFLPDNSSDRDITAGTSLSKLYPRVEELRKNTLDSMNNLEESIKQLELELSVESINPSSDDGAQCKRRVKENNSSSPSKRAASQTAKSKRVRLQPLLSPTSQQSSNTSTEQPHNKLQHPPCGSPEGRAEVLQQPNKSSNMLSHPHANTRRGL